jgi:hypothetical protein
MYVHQRRQTAALHASAELAGSVAALEARLLQPGWAVAPAAVQQHCPLAGALQLGTAGSASAQFLLHPAGKLHPARLPLNLRYQSHSGWEIAAAVVQQLVRGGSLVSTHH